MRKEIIKAKEGWLVERLSSTASELKPQNCQKKKKTQRNQNLIREYYPFIC
jgi:hypothetical protein